MSTTSLATLIETATPSGSGWATSGVPLLIPVATYTVSSNATSGTKTGTIQIGLEANATAPEPSGLSLAGIGARGFLAYSWWRRGRSR